MDEGLIQRWNAIVGPDDTVYVLGDVSFRNAAQSRALVTRLNGTKILIRGNHDRGVEAMCNMGFQGAPSNAVDVTDIGPVLMIHNPTEAASVAAQLQVGHVDLSEDGVSVKTASGLSAYQLVLCGHVHDHWRTKVIDGVRFVNVGVDVWDWQPVTLAELLVADMLTEPEGANRHIGEAYL